VKIGRGGRASKKEPTEQHERRKGGKAPDTNYEKDPATTDRFQKGRKKVGEVEKVLLQTVKPSPFYLTLLVHGSEKQNTFNNTHTHPCIGCLFMNS
jgi:hypothetical protein